MSVTIDASVFVSAARPTEIDHVTSFELVMRVVTNNEIIFCPNLMIAEFGASLSRASTNRASIMLALAKLQQLNNLNLVELTSGRVLKVAAVAIDHKLRGADSVYVQVAVETSSTLITWDKEMLARASSIVPTMTPSDWMAANPVVPASGTQ